MGFLFNYSYYTSLTKGSQLVRFYEKEGTMTFQEIKQKYPAIMQRWQDGSIECTEFFPFCQNLTSTIFTCFGQILMEIEDGVIVPESIAADFLILESVAWGKPIEFDYPAITNTVEHLQHLQLCESAFFYFHKHN